MGLHRSEKRQQKKMDQRPSSNLGTASFAEFTHTSYVLILATILHFPLPYKHGCAALCDHLRHAPQAVTEWHTHWFFSPVAFFLINGVPQQLAYTCSQTLTCTYIYVESNHMLQSVCATVKRYSLVHSTCGSRASDMGHCKQQMTNGHPRTDSFWLGMK